jgi:hypothetical protein
METPPFLQRLANLVRISRPHVPPSLPPVLRPAAVEVGTVEVATGAATRQLAATDPFGPQDAGQGDDLRHGTARIAHVTPPAL